MRIYVLLIQGVMELRIPPTSSIADLTKEPSGQVQIQGLLSLVLAR